MPLETTIDMDKAVIEAEQFVEMFADDRQLAAAAVDIARSQLETDMLANAQARSFRLAKTLASIESLGQHLSGIPGRKNLVWIGGGISISSRDRRAGHGTARQHRDLRRQGEDGPRRSSPSRASSSTSSTRRGSRSPVADRGVGRHACRCGAAAGSSRSRTPSV